METRSHTEFSAHPPRIASSRPADADVARPEHAERSASSEGGNLRDFLIALVCVSVIAGTGYSVYVDGNARLEAGDAAPAGEISFRSGETQRRYAARALWEQLDAGDIVYNHNSIRTGDASEALIRLNDDTQIELDQATMIVLQIQAGEIRLQLKQGSLEIRRSRPRYDRAITVGRGDHVLRLDSGQVRLESLPDEGMYVTPRLGKVVIQESSRTIQTGDRMLLAGSSGKQETLRIHLLHPRPGLQIQTAGDANQATVTFLWKTSAADANTSGNIPANIVEVSHDPDFTRIAGEIIRRDATLESSAEQRAELNLPGGVYYWRVRQGADRSPTGKFRVIQPEAVSVITPASGDRIKTKPDEQAGIQFAWRPVPTARYYRLEIFRKDQTNAAAVVSKKVEREYIRVALRPGRYSFRVRSFGSDPAAGRSSPLRDFQIQTGDAAPAVAETGDAKKNSIASASQTTPRTERVAIIPLRILYPGDGETVDMAKSTGINFHWRPARAGTTHRFRLFDLTGGGRRLIFETTTRDSRVFFKDLHALAHEGTYAWTIEAAGPQPGASGETNSENEPAQQAKFRVILSDQPDRPEFVSMQRLRSTRGPES